MDTQDNRDLTVTSTHNPTGEEILKENNNADIFIFNNVVYVNASEIQWVQNLNLTIGEKVGSITNVYKSRSKFTNGTATKLLVDTEIFKALGDRSNEVLLAKVDDRIIIYLALVEG
jgi:hypothetical protein